MKNIFATTFAALCLSCAITCFAGNQAPQNRFCVDYVSVYWNGFESSLGLYQQCQVNGIWQDPELIFVY
jgi:hypothetical protein